MCGSKGKIFTSIETHPPFRSLLTIERVAKHPDVIEDSSSDRDSDSSVSDCKSCVSGGSSSNKEEYHSHQSDDLFKSDRLVRLDEDERVHGLIKHKFLSCLGEYSGARTTKVIAIHRNNWSSSFAAQAKVQTFQLHRTLLMGRVDGSENDGCLKFAWFGTSKDGVDRIMTHGFGVSELEHNNGGIYLSPDDSPLDSVESSSIDDDGIRHVLLCRVLLGKSEVIHPDSVLQSHPTSQEFQSGVDSLSSPKKYVIWSTNMNTHILPEYVVSFKSDDDHPLSLSKATANAGGAILLSKKKKPTSPWMPFPALIRALSDFLPPTSVHFIAKYHKQYRDKKIQRNQLIQMVRQVAGDDLLMRVLKSWRSTKDRRAKFDLNV